MLKNQEIKMPVLIEDLGQQFQTCSSKRKYRFGIYRCSCGVEFRSRTNTVVSGHTKSCGCYKIKVSTTHGMTNHRLYGVWHDMINRVFNKNNKSFRDYGGRGITICDRWRDIKNFIEDMHPSYQEGLTIDRIDNDGNYEPSNCRWATKEIQMRNSRVLQSNNTSGYRGVCWHKSSKRWISQIGIGGKQVRIGFFETAIEAGKAYDTYVIANNLEHTINGVIDV